jgi:hypothetical protein
MSSAEVLAALHLPAASRIDQRVPKKLLLENGAPTAADKKLVSDGVEELRWVAALKPATVGVPAYVDAEREYLEVAVLLLSMRKVTRPGRLVELVHRAVPYPVLLVVEHSARPGLSVAHKRWAQREAQRVVLDGEVRELEPGHQTAAPHWQALLDALAQERQPRDSLKAFYDGWVNALVALEAARVTGSFSAAASAEEARRRSEALATLARLEVERGRLRAEARKTKQVPRQVELNLKLKRVEAAQEEARKKL